MSTAAGFACGPSGTGADGSAPLGERTSPSGPGHSGTESSDTLRYVGVTDK